MIEVVVTGDMLVSMVINMATRSDPKLKIIITLSIPSELFTFLLVIACSWINIFKPLSTYSKQRP